MGRKPTMKCKYCGKAIYTDMCSACRRKLMLIRKLLKMVKNTYERINNNER